MSRTWGPIELLASSIFDSPVCIPDSPVTKKVTGGLVGDPVFVTVTVLFSPLAPATDATTASASVAKPKVATPRRINLRTTSSPLLAELPGDYPLVPACRRQVSCGDVCAYPWFPSTTVSPRFVARLPSSYTRGDDHSSR